jgi:hypothetical protein
MGIRSIPDGHSALYYRLCRFVLFFIAASASFSGFYDKSHFREPGLRGDWYPTSFEAMMNGTAEKPYVYRRLLPDAINWIDRMTPPKTKEWLYRHQGSGLNSYIYAISLSTTAQNKVYFFRYLLLYLLTFAFAFLSAYAMYMVCREIGVGPPAATFAPVIFILLIPYFQTPSGFSYDYVELTLMCVSVWIAMKYEWYWLIPVAVLGTWNKETFLLFMPCLYPFVRQRRGRTATVAGIAVLFLLCCAIYMIARMRFAQNAGTDVMPQWDDQILEFTHLKPFVGFYDETFGLRVPRIYSVLPMALLIWTVVRGWRLLSSTLKQHAKIAAVINLPLFVLFCTPGEVRDLSLLYVTFLAMLALGLDEWIGTFQRVSQTQP